MKEYLLHCTLLAAFVGGEENAVATIELVLKLFEVDVEEGRIAGHTWFAAFATFAKEVEEFLCQFSFRLVSV